MLAEHEWKLKQDYLKIGATFGAKSKGSKGRGIAYEQRVMKRLVPHVVGMAGWTIMLGPWYQNLTTRRWRQPDAVLMNAEHNIGIVVEVKLNWKDGRDHKLIDVYLPLVKRAHKLDVVWPLMITRCHRGYEHPLILRLEDIDRAQSWLPGHPTPMLLLPC